MSHLLPGVLLRLSPEARATLTYCLVLPTEYQSFEMLRPSYLYRMFRTDQAGGPDDDASCL